MTEDDLKALAAIVKYVVFPVIGFAAGFIAQWFLQSRKSRDELLKELGLDPNTFEEEPVVELGSGETKTVTLWVTDCLVAKIGAEVVGEFGVCEDLREWRVPVATPRMGSEHRVSSSTGSDFYD